MICDIKDPLTQAALLARPALRRQARRRQYLKTTGIADTVYFGPELEFFVFDDVRFDQNANEGYYYVDCIEGSLEHRAATRAPNLGYKPRYKEGYFPVPPHDTLQDIRSEMILTMEKVGITVEVHHHEVATAGQCEIDMRFDDAD